MSFPFGAQGDRQRRAITGLLTSGLFFCRGEQAAAALEASLTALESKLDSLLAGFEASLAAGTGGDGDAAGTTTRDDDDGEEP